MPTPRPAFAAVAATLADVDPGDASAVEMFYRRQFVLYPPPVRALIADFVTGLSGMPTTAELDRLREAVNLPLSDVPEVEAPARDEAHGAAMEYEPTPVPGKSAAAGV
jgi:hypothetical protein